MIVTGIGDEAGNKIEMQIAACKELGWKYLEMRGVQVAGHPKGNFHDIPDEAFDTVVAQLEKSGLGVYCFGSTIMSCVCVRTQSLIAAVAVPGARSKSASWKSAP